jgi:hypothetical protein
LQVIWVLENIKGNESFYNELDSLLLYASVVQMRKHHSSFISKYILYCDELTLSNIKNEGKESLWTEINILPKNNFIDKSIFWASSKLEVLRYIKEPTLVLDHDFIVYREIKNLRDNTMLFAHEEDGTDYYPSRHDGFIRSIADMIPIPGTKAINCCFNYFPDYKFANTYAKFSLEIMERLTKAKAESSKYLIFAEQLVLKYLIDYYNLPYTTLLKAKWLSKELVWENTNNGLVDIEEMNLHFRHYWMDKPNIRESKNGFDYKEEIRILNNVVNNY